MFSEHLDPYTPEMRVISVLVVMSSQREEEKF